MVIGGYLLPFDYLRDVVGSFVVLIPIFDGWEPDKALFVLCIVMILIGYFVSKNRGNVKRRFR